ncbi:fimbrial protein [Pseudomonas sp. OST1909]|uniref:fimbrial protein n=1 Tax=Pseudomonas sp. OST1909 TaxID=2777367 RepID=UPI0018876283|nr:fimbrial protein [Pseudomonas sp. OST1909]QOY72408.1 type 1 fimbrial protein [Pseudomonas sp. OST1909]
MNRPHLAFAALASIFVMSGAHAADGTINFTGELTAQTCTSTVNGTTSVPTVTLPKLSTASLASAGATAGSTNFTIELSKCTGTIATAAAIFEAGTGVDPVTKNLVNTGTAKNVQFQLLDSAGKVIRAGDTASQVSNTTRTAMSAGTAVLPYAVQYVASGASTAGTVVGSVTYSINYQ